MKRGEFNPGFVPFFIHLDRILKEIHAAGVPVTAGTDTPIGLNIPGESLLRELELLVAKGFSPQEALYAATIEPTHFFGLQDSKGQIAEGMEADLILLRANPLQDISNLRAIERVMSNGTWVR
ncbi:amidohydrolase family protein [Aestuariicella sp. G3-2]|uniref:amidohydrolase family protein n=1 Tax=Pseudomaricurvus albidus TaxID=2842452 RepID=UPI001C0C842E|nr:amidohydrolase family protein [Aestuariicella albida]MBU3070943.1 amidohydrolase family protein [Aestuariicella albida]